MSVAAVKPIYPREGLFPISVEMYQQMVGAGVFDEDDPIELIEGALVLKMSKNEPHSVALSLCEDELRRALTGECFVRNQDAITLSDSVPEPDLVVARGSRRDYLAHHPFASDVLLVIEVADTSLSYDRGTKMRVYARAGISHYWIVNLIDRVIEVYENPQSDLPEPAYAAARIVKSDESISLPALIGGATLKVADLLP